MPKENLDFVISVVAASLFILLLIVAAALLFRIYLKRKNRLLLEKERMSVQFEQTLLRSKLEIQEQTFTDISREIHDNIGQVLSLVRLNLNRMDHSIDPEKMNLMDELMGKAITDLRNLSHSLDSDMIRNSGWVKATERLLTDLQKTGTFKVSFQAEEKLPGLGTEKPIILFRMIQEVVNNIIKHSQATEIQFRATKKTDHILIEIGDNGKGFDKTGADAGAGLKNLSSRSLLIQATTEIQSSPGQGTLVSILINTGNYD